MVCYFLLVAHAVCASLLAGFNYIGVVQNDDDLVSIKKGFAGLETLDDDDNVEDNVDNVQN